MKTYSLTFDTSDLEWEAKEQGEKLTAKQKQAIFQDMADMGYLNFTIPVMRRAYKIWKRENPEAAAEIVRFDPNLVDGENHTPELSPVHHLSTDGVK